jgi:hypothetical protein
LEELEILSFSLSSRPDLTLSGELGSFNGGINGSFLSSLISLGILRFSYVAITF